MPVFLLRVFMVQVLLLFAMNVCAEVQISGIATSDEVIKISLKGLDESAYRLYAVRTELDDDTSQWGKPVYVGVLKDKVIELARYEAGTGRDRLYDRFVIVRSGGNQIVDSEYVTDFSKLTRHEYALEKPESIKGLQAIVDLDDGISLGIKHATLNINLAAMLSAGNKETAVFHEVDKQRIYFRPHLVQHFDRKIKKLTEANVRLYFILLNYLPGNPNEHNPLIHPATNRAESPNRLSAFNTTDEAGVRAYRAVIEFLAERYSRPDKRYGRVSGYIVGNEVQSHWWWYNMGDISKDVVIDHYIKALRITHTAVRQYHSGFKVYVSMDHFWNRAHRPNEPGKSMSGKYLFDEIHRRVKREGDFDWHVAHHPYPENLRNPRFWNDRTALHRFDTPRITFKNIEVLAEYVRQDQFLIDGAARRIILSEQGFDLPDTPDGEQVQAAAYAYAYRRVLAIEGIDAFILHRYVDHAREGGLRLGLRAYKPGTITAPGKKRMVYDIFKAADTGEWEKAFEFALPIVGLKSWEGAKALPVKRK